VTTTAPPVTGLPHLSLPARLEALAKIAAIGAGRSGPDGFSPELVAEAQALLERAGERQRLSAAHTVVTLGGGTGSGKSSLFNALSGANFSPAGVTRPSTRHTHACVWGMEGAAPLLDWLGVQRRHRYARASALDAGEASLAGLLLLDLPDHDSVVTASSTVVDRLTGLADMMVWVLDPQKYADASVHRRYLVPLAGHGSVTTIVLNQADLLSAEQVDDCESDLRRLLDSEGLAETRLLVVSAVTGKGLDELRRVLVDVVSARQAATERIEADIDALISGFTEYVRPELVRDAATVTAVAGREALLGGTGPGDAAGSTPAPARPPWADATLNGTAASEPDPDAATPAAAGPDNAAAAPAPTRPPWGDVNPDGSAVYVDTWNPVESVPAEPSLVLADAFAKAAGLSAVTDALQDVRSVRAARYVSWPPASLAGALPGRDPVRKMRLGALRGELRTIAASAAEGQQSDIDNAITAFAEEVATPLPPPWSGTVKAAARSRSGEIKSALGVAVRESMPEQDRVVSWWRLIRLWQWVLVAAALAGLVWIGLIVAFGVFHAERPAPSSLVGQVSLIPWIGVMIAAMLLLGWLTASGCSNMVMLAAERERERAEQQMRSRVDAVARELVLMPAGVELVEYERFRTELAAARGGALVKPKTPRWVPPPPKRSSFEGQVPLSVRDSAFSLSA
jgi:hypothetical protein